MSFHPVYGYVYKRGLEMCNILLKKHLIFLFFFYISIMGAVNWN